MTEQFKRPWGEYIVTEKTKIIRIKPNQKLSLQYHHYREEIWEILSGSGKITIGEEIFETKPGDIFTIPKKEKHRAEAGAYGLEFLEISKGEIDEDDFVRLNDDYGRASKKEAIVINSGYFDPLHIGHLECMKLSKKLGDKLVVILNNDEQCILKKEKAFMPLDEKKKILESIKFVDEVFVSIDKDKSVCESIKAVAEKYKGHEIIFAKGGDRFSDEIPEAKLCRELGIEIKEGVGKKIQSSSNLTGLKK
ncbi:MAG: adenylyltransferase/cytidyltransferase family protein [archaeon]